MEKLTKAEAVHFVTTVLKIDSPLQKLEKDRVQFLHELNLAYQRTMPFQNIDTVAQEPAKRHTPTWEEIKDAAMRSRGGRCYVLNVFMKTLLEALGYDVHHAACNIFSPNNHMTTIVRNLTSPGSKHLVDISAYPTFEIVSLDFEKESPVYNHSFLEFKFVREGDTIARYHRKGENRPKMPTEVITPDGWRRVIVIDPTPRELDYFDHSMNEAYTIPGKTTPFLVTFRAVVFKDLKLTAIKNTTLLTEKDNHSLEAKEMATREEMIKMVGEHFPQFPSDMVARAIDTLQLFGKTD